MQEFREIGGEIVTYSYEDHFTYLAWVIPHVNRAVYESQSPSAYKPNDGLRNRQTGVWMVYITDRQRPGSDNLQGLNYRFGPDYMYDDARTT